MANKEMRMLVIQPQGNLNSANNLIEPGEDSSQSLQWEMQPSQSFNFNLVRP